MYGVGPARVLQMNASRDHSGEKDGFNTNCGR